MRRKIVVLTGAGVSAESGVPTFRDAGGLWEGHRVEEVASPEGYAANPALVHEFYNLRRRQVRQVEPNAAHLALAEAAARWDGEFLLVTQNVDDLHDRAHRAIPPAPGFELIHMHGELLKARCTATEQVVDWLDDLTVDSVSPFGPAGRLRPHIVWFGEMPFGMDRIGDALRACDLFVSIGTSGSVYPAAGFVRTASRAGAYTVELNLEPSEGSRNFRRLEYGPATEVVPEFLRSLGALP
jgi:NAD-dependent deacetylase